MRKGESKVIPGDMAQQQTADGPQELPTLRHIDLLTSASQKRTILKLYNIYALYNTHMRSNVLGKHQQLNEYK